VAALRFSVDLRENGAMSRRSTAERHEGLQRELNEERAAALMRISRTLESLIGELSRLREEMAQGQGRHGPQRDEQLARYRELRRRAVRHRWYLEVQREALGLRHHQYLDEFYAIPEPPEP
jgi:hypothetical protein